MLFDQDEYSLELEDVLDRFKDELSKISTGKPSITLFDGIKVMAYDTTMPLSGIATISTDPTDPMSILLRVFDKANTTIVTEAIEKADFYADIQQNDSVIRLRFKPITEEDRAEKTKMLPQITEKYKSRARDLRREYNDKVEALEKVSEDEQIRSLEKIQEILKGYEEKIEELARNKKQELMTI